MQVEEAFRKFDRLPMLGKLCIPTVQGTDRFGDAVPKSLLLSVLILGGFLS